jgi:PleD family two-component response regulator
LGGEYHGEGQHFHFYAAKTLNMFHGKILIIDDESDIVTTWTMRLERLGFTVATAANGQAGLSAMVHDLPDLVLLDVMLPQIDGIALCRRLKQDAVTAQIPIVLLTAKGTLQDKLTGMDSGADDYITKDADPAEIEARIKMVLRRSRANLGANPLTKLPGTSELEHRLQGYLAGQELFAVGYADLDNFKAYNDTYGFVKGDQVIKQAAAVLIEAVRRCGRPGDFVGHIGGDDFVFITAPSYADVICRTAIARLDQEFPAFYTDEDRRRGFIATRDRQGQMRQFPLLSISIAVVTNDKKPLSSVGEIARIAAEIKKYLKTLSGSNYAQDKRSTI